MSGIIRQDGRKPSQLRTLQLDHSHLRTSDGSARLSLGKTAVDVSVFGPIDDPTRLDHTKIDRATLFVEVQSIHSGSTQTTEEVHLEWQLRRMFEGVVMSELYPQTVIHCKVQVLCDDGALDSCAVNALSCALMDAGIECRTMLSAVTLGVSSSIEDRASLATLMDDGALVAVSDGDGDGEGEGSGGEEKVERKSSKIESIVVFDPTAKEMELMKCVATIAWASKVKKGGKKKSDDDHGGGDGDGEAQLQLEYSECKGDMALKDLQRVLEHSQRACAKLQFVMKRHFVESYKAAPTIWVDYSTPAPVSVPVSASSVSLEK